MNKVLLIPMTMMSLILFFGLSVQGATYKTVPRIGKVEFFAKGKPALLTIHGEGMGLESLLTEKNKIINGKFTFNLKTLKTGIDLRDEHLKNKYLEIERYPLATLEITDFNLPEPSQKDFAIKGLFELHGSKKPVEGLATLLGDSPNLKLSASLNIKLSQFNIEIPNFKGITVAEDVLIKVEVPVTREE
jgi:hypothetical protein